MSINKGVQKIFSEVSCTYDLANHVLTWGLDILWRKRAAKLAAAGGGTRWMDVCSGTGETAIYLNRLAKNKARVFAADFCLPMMHEATEKSDADQVIFTIADAGALPFQDGTFDVVTISFATRNINVSRDRLIKCLQEFHRILKPGGLFVNLETSQPPWRFIRSLFHLYVRLAILPIGYAISGSKSGYLYFSKTIPRFYNAVEFADIIRQAGFNKVKFQLMTFGMVATHEAIK